MELGPRFLPKPTTAAANRCSRVGEALGDWGRLPQEQKPLALRSTLAHHGADSVDRVKRALPNDETHFSNSYKQPDATAAARCLRLTDVDKAAVVLQPLARPSGRLLGLLLFRHLGALAAHLSGTSQRAVDLACTHRSPQCGVAKERRKTTPLARS